MFPMHAYTLGSAATPPRHSPSQHIAPPSSTLNVKPPRTSSKNSCSENSKRTLSLNRSELCNGEGDRDASKTTFRTRCNVKPITRGNNSFGRKGCKRCLQCRKWKLKCIYQCLEMPCLLCEARGFVCGVAEKVDSPKARETPATEQFLPSDQPTFKVAQSPPTPQDEVLTDLDKMYLRRLSSVRCDFVISEKLQTWLSCFEVARYNRYTRSLDRYFIELRMFPLQSKAIRYGYLILASGNLSESQSQSNLNYLGKFYRFTSEAIGRSSYLEIFVASCLGYYYECLYGRQRARMKSLLLHFQGMCAAGEQLMRCRTASDPYLKLIFTLCSRFVHVIYYHYCFWIRDSPDYTVSTGFIKATRELVTFYSQYLPSIPVNDVTNGGFTTFVLARLLFLELDVFLASQNDITVRQQEPGFNRDVDGTVLQNVIQLITNSLPRFPEWPGEIDGGNDLHPWESGDDCSPLMCESKYTNHSTTLINRSCRAWLLFGITNLLRDMLFPTLAQESVKTATHLCRMCNIVIQSCFIRSPFDILQLARALFWSGCVLTRKVNPQANDWIWNSLIALQSGLHQTHKAAECADSVFPILFNFLEKLNSRSLFEGGNAAFSLALDGEEMLRCDKLLHSLHSFLYSCWEGFETEEVM